MIRIASIDQASCVEVVLSGFFGNLVACRIREHVLKQDSKGVTFHYLSEDKKS
jgi:hypothetical protein